jgi:spore coat polysaccharide biosynthesis protein SpsF
MNIVATIQARMGSTRLPGKVLKEVCGKPLLQYQIERIRRSRLVDDVVIATSSSAGDDAIVEFAEKLNVKVYRGPEDDVLKRISGLLQALGIGLHVELIGDSPLADPQIIDEVVGYYLKNQSSLDYVSCGTEVTYPAGMEVNVYPSRILIAAEQAVAPDDPLREHVDIHIRNNPAYRSACLRAPKHFHRPDIFLEVDTEQDFEMVTAVIEHFVRLGKTHFSLSQIIDYLEQRPDLVKHNQSVDRKYWQFKSKPAFPT